MVYKKSYVSDYSVLINLIYDLLFSIVVNLIKFKLLLNSSKLKFSEKSN